MPNIDVSTIDGFDAMTPEQKVEALLKLEVPEKVDLSGFIPKTQFDRASSELAEAKRQLKDRMTDEEAQKAEREAKWAEMEEKLKKLEQEKLESNYKASYLALGYDDALAEDTAKALASGDMQKVFENQKKAAAAAEGKLKEQLMKDTPVPGGSSGSDKKDPENIEVAKRLGKTKAESLQSSDDILKRYL